MTALHTSCLLCQSKDLHPLPEEYAHAYLVQCKSCGLVFGSRIPTQEELQAHYAQYPRNTSVSPVTVKRYEELLEKMEPWRKTSAGGGKILDVGCGDGHFLEAAKRKGWDVYGTEFTDEAIASCRAKGINMFKGSIQDYDVADHFDVIASFEVLEHINDGREHVRKIHSLLRPGGLFYFTTPNFNSLSRKRLGGKWNVIEYPEHLTYYTASTITRLLAEAGFKKLEVRTTGFSPQRFQLSKGTATRSGNSDESLRIAIEEKAHLRFAKNAANGLLNFFRAGDTLKGFFTKP